MITKYGKVIITDHGILIENFHSDDGLSYEECLRWAKKHLEKELSNIAEASNDVPA